MNFRRNPSLCNSSSYWRRYLRGGSARAIIVFTRAITVSTRAITVSTRAITVSTRAITVSTRAIAVSTRAIYVRCTWIAGSFLNARMYNKFTNNAQLIVSRSSNEPLHRVAVKYGERTESLTD